MVYFVFSSQDGLSALAWAAKEGYDEIITKLIDKGAFLNMPDRVRYSPLLVFLVVVSPPSGQNRRMSSL
jgi:Ankyrin repeat.